MSPLAPRLATIHSRSLLAVATAVALLGALAILCAPVPASNAAIAVTQDQSPRTLRSVGAWPLEPAIRLWSEAHRLRNPDIAIEIESVRAADALAALATGRSDLAPLTRMPTPQELDAFRRAAGHEPLIVDVGYEAIAIAVHRENPVAFITIAQLDSIFSTTRNQGGDAITQWRDLGVGGPLGDEAIWIFGPSLNAAGHRLFRDVVLLNGTFRADMAEQPGPSAAMNAASSYRNALAFSSRALPTRRARLVPVSADAGAPVSLTPESVADGTYPLARRLMIAVRRVDARSIDPQVAEFLRLALSVEGQELAAERGTVPLTDAARRAQRAKLD